MSVEDGSILMKVGWTESKGPWDKRDRNSLSGCPLRPGQEVDQWEKELPVFTEDMRRVVLEQKLGFVATVCPDGTPNLSPKGTTTLWDDEHLVFADIASPGTVENLRSNSAVEINVVDPFLRKGYRFKGTATLHSDDLTYERGLELLAERGYAATPDRVKTIVLVRVTKAAPLISPAYQSGATEDRVRGQWIDYYRALHGESVQHSNNGPDAE
jgi:predicted pyridoxine 5'-phosphate oxidase superfamily flavin-nucleotide-binding protein